MNDKFRTQKGYDMNRENNFTYVMEDYLEMIYRLCISNGYTRTSRIAKELNVQAAAVSKMIIKLKEQGFVLKEKYGIIRLTEKGLIEGEYLFKRHNVIYNFFCRLTGDDVQLDKIEQIEHFIDEKMLNCMKKFIEEWDNAKNKKA